MGYSAKVLDWVLGHPGFIFAFCTHNPDDLVKTTTLWTFKFCSSSVSFGSSEVCASALSWLLGEPTRHCSAMVRFTGAGSKQILFWILVLPFTLCECREIASQIVFSHLLEYGYCELQMRTCLYQKTNRRGDNLSSDNYESWCSFNIRLYLVIHLTLISNHYLSGSRENSEELS